MSTISELKPNQPTGDYFEGLIHLTGWDGFQDHSGAYNGKNEHHTAAEIVKINIEASELNGVKIVTQEQIDAISYLSQNSLRIKNSLLLALLNELPRLWEIYDDLIPAINSIDDFNQFMGLSQIHILPSARDGYAYVGFEFGCDWDEEHGVGVMMHRERVIEIGAAETSFDIWVTFNDNGTMEVEYQKWVEANAKLQNSQVDPGSA